MVLARRGQRTSAAQWWLDRVVGGARTLRRWPPREPSAAGQSVGFHVCRDRVSRVVRVARYFVAASSMTGLINSGYADYVEVAPNQPNGEVCTGTSSPKVQHWVCGWDTATNNWNYYYTNPECQNGPSRSAPTGSSWTVTTGTGNRTQVGHTARRPPRWPHRARSQNRALVRLER